MASSDRKHGDKKSDRRERPRLLDRQPPCDLDAERGVLGSILLDPDCADDVALQLRPDDFYSDAHQKLYAHLLAMHSENVRIDLTILVDRLRRADDYEAIGGSAYLAELVQGVPHAAHAKYYANIVRDKSTLRSLIYTSSEILQDSYEGGLETRELLARAEQKIFGILENRGGGEASVLRDVLLEAMERIDSRMQNQNSLGGTETGYLDLDQMTGGLHGSELLILAARPSMGKTAFAANIAEHVAVDGRQPVLFVSLEMSKLELADRLLCSRARVNGHRLRNGDITSEERSTLIQTANDMSEAPLFIDDSPSRTVAEIAATARRIKRKHGLGMIVIDYLQLIEPDNSSDPRQEQVAKIARRLKAMARELDVPLLCLAQLNRQAEASKDNRPRLSHLRESGAIEQDADVVMFVHREEYYHTPEEVEQLDLSGRAMIIIAKQRNGPVGEVRLTWLQNFTRFEDAAPEYQVDPF